MAKALKLKFTKIWELILAFEEFSGDQLSFFDIWNWAKCTLFLPIIQSF